MRRTLLALKWWLVLELPEILGRWRRRALCRVFGHPAARERHLWEDLCGRCRTRHCDAQLRRDLDVIARTLKYVLREGRDPISGAFREAAGRRGDAPGALHV